MDGPPPPVASHRRAERRVDDVVRGVAQADPGRVHRQALFRHGGQHASLLQDGWDEVEPAQIGLDPGVSGPLSAPEPVPAVLARPHGLLEAPRLRADGAALYSDVLAGGVFEVRPGRGRPGAAPPAAAASAVWSRTATAAWW